MILPRRRHFAMPGWRRSSSAAAATQLFAARELTSARLCHSARDRKNKLERRYGGPKAGDTIVVAMSGGVDSSLSASLLSKSPLNFDLRPVYMRNWNTLDEGEDFQPGSGGSTGCEWQQEWKDVQAVCDYLGLGRRAGTHKPQLMDLSREYWTRVFEPALDMWASGQTPNPDVSCNREIKFGALTDALFRTGSAELREKAQQGTAWLATGHYAGIRDQNKDQSYYLSSVQEDSLSLACFPLTNLLKKEVKALAREHGLPTADREESMGLCFVGERKSSPSRLTGSPGSKRVGLANAGFSAFLNLYLPETAAENGARTGPVIELETGRQVGEHQGLHTVTIGQNARIAGVKSRLFVAKKEKAMDAGERDVVYVVAGREHPALMCKRLTVRAGQFHWIGDPPSTLTQDPANASMRALAQIRHRQPQVSCSVRLLPSHERVAPAVQVTFDAPVDGVSEGQVAALWTEDGVTLGSGVVHSTETMADAIAPTKSATVPPSLQQAQLDAHTPQQAHLDDHSPV